MHSIGNHLQKKKIIYWMGENICKWYAKIYKQLIKLNIKKKKKKTSDPIEKWAEEINMCFSKENVEMGSRHRKCVQHRYSSKIRIAMRYPLVSVRTDIIKKKTCHQYQSCSITETVFSLPWVGVNSAGFSGSQQGFYVFRLVCKVTHIIDVRKEFWRPHWEK